MKKLLLLTTAAVASGVCYAQDVGRVLSATPVIQQVGVPRQVCTTEQVAVQQPKSGAGAVMGAIAGGAMGNAIGGGGGKAAATMLGIFGGAVLGDRIEGAPMASSQNVQRCAVQTFYENRAVSYNVVYEFAGKQYTVQMPQDPGPTLQLQVTPVGAIAQPPQHGYSNGQTQQADDELAQAYVQPQQVIVMQPAYPRYYQQPYYPPISLELGYGYWGGQRGRGYRH